VIREGRFGVKGAYLSCPVDVLAFAHGVGLGLGKVKICHLVPLTVALDTDISQSDVPCWVEGFEVWEGQFTRTSGGEESGGETGENGSVEWARQNEVISDGRDGLRGVGFTRGPLGKGGSEGRGSSEKCISFCLIGRPLEPVNNVPSTDTYHIVRDCTP